MLASLRGYRVYLLAFVLALPDILDALGAVDLSALVPPGYASKAAAALALARIVLGTTIRRLPPAPPAAPPGGQG